MAQNEPQRKETPPGPSPNSPSLLFEYQCRSGKVIRLAKSNRKKIDSAARIESNRLETFLPELECSSPQLCISMLVAERRAEKNFNSSILFDRTLTCDRHSSHMPIASIALAQRLAVKIVHTPVKCNNITITFYSFNNNSYVFD